MELTTPVAFLVFNRPQLTQQVFERIAQAQPRKLLVVADGPRATHPDDAAKVKATRAVIDCVDWPCELLANFSEHNLGCKRRVASGLDWVFEQVEEAIILEDDCVPDPSFFYYCSELLERYRNDQRIMTVSGNNFQTGRKWGTKSYLFSKHFNCWGWATWRRVWNMYDVDMATWPEFLEEGGLSAVCDCASEEEYWYGILRRAYEGRIDTWDYAFTYMIFSQHGLTVLPNTNLISNIGFGEHATHTLKASSGLANYPTAKMQTVTHPACIARHKEADNFIYRHHFNQKSRRLRKKLATITRSCLRLGKPPKRFVDNHANATRQQPAKAA